MKSKTKNLKLVALLSTVLIAVTGFGVANVTAYADDVINTEVELQEAIEVGGTVTLGGDIELTDGLIVAKGTEVTLDLNGYTLSMEVTKQITANNSLIVNKGNLTIVDKSDAQTGTISYYFNGTANKAWAYAVTTISNQQGTLTIKGGLIESLSTATNVYKFTIDNITNGTGGDAVLNIEAGEITAEKGGSIRGFANSTANECVINITGGSMLGQVWLQDPNEKANNGTLAISGGEISPNAVGVDAVYLYGNGDASGMNVSLGGNVIVNGSTYLTSVNTTADFTAEITGGIYNGDVWVCTWDVDSASKDIPAISGGEFTTDVSDYVSDGFKLFENEDGTFSAVDEDWEPEENLPGTGDDIETEIDGKWFIGILGALGLFGTQTGENTSVVVSEGLNAAGIIAIVCGSLVVVIAAGAAVLWVLDKKGILKVANFFKKK